MHYSHAIASTVRRIQPSLHSTSSDNVYITVQSVPVATPSSKKAKKSLTSRLMKGFNSYVSGSGRVSSSESSSPAPVSPSPSSLPAALMRDRDRDDDADVDVDREEDEAIIAMRNNIAGEDDCGEVVHDELIR